MDASFTSLLADPFGAATTLFGKLFAGAGPLAMAMAVMLLAAGIWLWRRPARKGRTNVTPRRASAENHNAATATCRPLTAIRCPSPEARSASRCPPTTIHSSGRSEPGSHAIVFQIVFTGRTSRSSLTVTRTVAGPGPTW